MHKISSFSRIVIVGTTGSGKSTLAKRLSGELKLIRIELDSIHWRPNWTEAPKHDFIQRVEHAVSVDRWVVEGNYRAVRHLIWTKAEAIVWLDYSFPRNFWQLFSRTIHRLVTKKELWAGNRESWGMFFSRKSILIWFFQTYWRRRREYPMMLADPKYSHLKVFRINHPKQLEIHL